jgi:nicotinamide-nucleotide amidase
MNNCLVIIRNKKLNFDSKFIEELTASFSSSGYYFDKIAYVAFDNSTLITSQLRECKDNFDNSLVVCDSAQVKAVSDFLDKIFEGSNGRGNVQVLDASALSPSKYQEIIKSWNERFGISYDKMYIKCVSAPSKLINQAMQEASKIVSDVTVNVYNDHSDQTITITYSSQTTKMVADAILRVFVTVLDDYIYALENISLAQRLFHLLQLRRMKISVAESFTGGGICQKLVEVSGISQVFDEGLNTYSNHAKVDRLGVKELTLKQSGAVSDETACQMAQGLIDRGNCDLAISTTGIAGPNSDNTNKPVGLAYIGIATKENVAVYKFNFTGDRSNITKTAINQALFLAFKRIK